MDKQLVYYCVKESYISIGHDELMNITSSRLIICIPNELLIKVN